MEEPHKNTCNDKMCTSCSFLIITKYVEKPSDNWRNDYIFLLIGDSKQHGKND